MSVPRSISPRRLPKKPSLEQLRKQAKDLLRAYRSGDPDAIAQIHSFERNTSPAGFALSDAQRVIARGYGFASWPKLKAFVDGVTVARFAEAVKRSDIAQVRSMLASRPELIAMDMSANDEHRALHFAVLQRDAAMVRLLMEAGADARKGIFPHRDATSAMALAREREYTDIAVIIEEEERCRREATTGPNKAATALADGLTALDHAALAADPRNDRAREFPVTAKQLLAQGAELTVRAAVALGDQVRVRELILAQPGLLRQISVSGGLLTLAVNHAQLDMVRLLLDLGADVNECIVLQELEEPTESWGMPLWYAALANDLAITQLLLDRGADPNGNVYASGWPLRNAWNHRDDAVKKLLLERGARPQPYMVAEAHDVEEARRLLAGNPSEGLARELVWSAADHGCPEIVELALPHLNWLPQDPRWNWVLIQPIRGAGGNSSENEGHFRSMAALLRHGVDANVSRFGQTPLHFTAGRQSDLPGEDRARFAAMLIDHGASVNLRDDLLRSTPLGWACRWGRLELAELLIARGATVQEVDAEPWATPIAWARKMNRDAIVVLLERGSV
jgi:ankyrin repeat protein